MCILAVRAVIVQIAFFLHMQVHVFGRPAVFSRPLIFATTFMSFFSLVIALFKDIPDMEGDKIFGIQSFTLRLGQEKVFWICISLLQMAYAVAILVGASSSFLWSKIVTVSRSIGDVYLKKPEINWELGNRIPLKRAVTTIEPSIIRRQLEPQDLVELIIVGWILVMLTFILCGIFLVLHRNVFTDDPESEPSDAARHVVQAMARYVRHEVSCLSLTDTEAMLSGNFMFTSLEKKPREIMWFDGHTSLSHNFRTGILLGVLF